MNSKFHKLLIWILLLSWGQKLQYVETSTRKLLERKLKALYILIPYKTTNYDLFLPPHIKHKGKTPIKVIKINKGTEGKQKQGEMEDKLKGLSLVTQW